MGLPILLLLIVTTVARGTGVKSGFPIFWFSISTIGSGRTISSGCCSSSDSLTDRFNFIISTSSTCFVTSLLTKHVQEKQYILDEISPVFGAEKKLIPTIPAIITKIARQALDRESTRSWNTKIPQQKETKTDILDDVAAVIANPAVRALTTYATPAGTQNNPESNPNGVNLKCSTPKKRTLKDEIMQRAVLYVWKTSGSTSTARTASLFIGTLKLPNAKQDTIAAR
mmetsp:Transcript_3631/g.5562  ORF Transcript_3631/g.5562 Transcript_3631/m.5562 type:complete len:227 (+) Transcript_3631:3075-3755(+)